MDTNMQITDTQKQLLVKAINKAIKEPDGINEASMNNFTAAAKMDTEGDDNELTVAEAQQWLTENGYTWERAYYESMTEISGFFAADTTEMVDDNNHIENVFADAEATKQLQIPILNQELNRIGGHEFKNPDILTHMTNELYDYLQGHDIKADDIDNLIAGFNTKLLSMGITASNEDLITAKNILTNLFNESAQTDGDNTSMTLSDAMNTSFLQKQQTEIPIVTDAINLAGGTEFENPNISKFMATELLTYLTGHNLKEENIDNLVSNFNISLRNNGIIASANDLQTVKNVLTNIFNAAAVDHDDGKAMTYADLSAKITELMSAAQTTADGVEPNELYTALLEMETAPTTEAAPLAAPATPAAPAVDPFLEQWALFTAFSLPQIALFLASGGGNNPGSTLPPAAGGGADTDTTVTSCDDDDDDDDWNDDGYGGGDGSDSNADGN